MFNNDEFVPRERLYTQQRQEMQQMPPMRATMGDDSQWGQRGLNNDRFDTVSEHPQHFNKMNQKENGDSALGVAWLHQSSEPEQQEKKPKQISWPSRSEDDSTKPD